MNSINWFEIPVANFERATAFYEQVLATKLDVDTSFPGMRLAILPYRCPGVGGALFEHAEARPHADGVRIYLNADPDLAPLLDRVTAAGGQVIMPKTHLRDDIGYIGMFRDSEGNIVGLHSMG